MDLQPALMRRAFYLLPLLMLVSQYSALVAAVPTPVEPIARGLGQVPCRQRDSPRGCPETMMVANSDAEVRLVDGASA